MKLIIGFVVLALLWGGGQALYTAATNSTPAVLTYEELMEGGTKSKWVRIEGGQLNLLEASYKSSAGSDEVKEVFAPLFSTVEAEGTEGEPEKVRVLVASTDAEVVALLNEMGELKDEAAVMTYIGENQDRIFDARPIEGLVRFGIDLDDGDKKELARLNENLVEDFIIIDEGKKPSWGKAVMLPIGLVLAFFLFRPKKQAAPATA